MEDSINTVQKKSFFKRAIAPAKNIWQYILAIFVMSSIFIPFVWKGPYEDLHFTAIALIWSFAIWFTQILGHTIIFQLWDRVFSWTRQPIARASVGILSIIVYAALAFVGVQILMKLVFFGEWPEQSFWELILDSGMAIKIAAVFSVIATLIGFLNAWRKSELAREKLKTQMMVHKYNALQNQINPHFLFNSFNVLSELVYENQELAVKFIRQLSDLYRYVLSVKNEDLVSVKREVDFIESFAFLLKTRFENQLEISIDVQASDDEFIIPMSLQLLIENAVKHNLATTVNPLQIIVKRKENVICVENNLQRKDSVEHSTKTGLKNIRDRYAHLTGKEIEVVETAKKYSVSIPIITTEK